MAIATINPATGERLESFRALAPAELESRLQRATERFPRFQATTFVDRARWLTRAANLLEAEKQKLGELMTLEMGKPLAAAIAEAEKCARACLYYAEHAQHFLADEAIPTDHAKSFVRFQPLGVVLAVMPWNFPFWQVFRFAAPALMAGNVALLKHASNVPQCALAIDDLLRRAGFPEGCFQTLLIGSDAVSDLLADRRVAAVSLTGSVGAGQKVASTAGAHLKKCVLELGGSDPFVVMPSADLDAAVKTGVQARIVNNGQSCIAAKRFIVHDAIADAFEEKFVEQMRALKVGDPREPATQVGPLATKQGLEDLEQQVRKTVEGGARLLCGGKRLEGPGFFYAPTVLADIPRESPAFREELFGPVASIFRASSLDAAIELANATEFGLAASAWSRDPAEQARLIDGLQAGQVFINAMVVSDPRLPFGGIKSSGYGRELGPYGVREFVNAKSVALDDVAGSSSAVE